MSGEAGAADDRTRCSGATDSKSDTDRSHGQGVDFGGQVPSFEPAGLFQVEHPERSLQTAFGFCTRLRRAIAQEAWSPTDRAGLQDRN